MDMTKFEYLNDPGFIAVAGELRRWIKELAAGQSSQVPTSASQIPFAALSLGAGGQSSNQGGNLEPGMAGHFYQGMPTAG